MEWIKLSERLPEKGIGLLDYIWIRNNSTKCGGMVPLSNLNKIENIHNVEWLDETEDKSTELIRKYFELMLKSESGIHFEFLLDESGWNKEARKYYKLIKH